MIANGVHIGVAGSGPTTRTSSGQEGSPTAPKYRRRATLDVLALFATVFPVLPGKEAAVKQFAKDMQSKKKDFEKSEKRLDVKRETWFLQTSPQGTLVIVNFEAKDLNKALTGFAKSTDPFDVWMKDQVKQLTGLDMSAPMTGPLPELLFSYGY